jgi:hypothetical protein
MTTKVYAENSFNLADDLHGGGTVTVQHDAFILSKVDNALEVLNGPWTFKIDGFLLRSSRQSANADCPSDRPPRHPRHRRPNHPAAIPVWRCGLGISSTA